MATKKGAAKKGSSKKGSGKKSASKSSGLIVGGIGGAIGGAVIERVVFDRATAELSKAVQRAVASQPTFSRLRSPIIVGIWYNPRTKQVEIINQLEQF